MHRQFLKFAIAGGIGFMVDAGVLYLALALGTGLYIGRVISFFCAVFVTWQINRRVTFERPKERSIWREWWEYLLAMAVGGVCNYGAYLLALSLLSARSLSPLIAVAEGSIAGMFVNFIIARWWVFRKSRA